jgi:hypothetical protein
MILEETYTLSNGAEIPKLGLGTGEASAMLAVDATTRRHWLGASISMPYSGAFAAARSSRS